MCSLPSSLTPAPVKPFAAELYYSVSVPILSKLSHDGPSIDERHLSTHKSKTWLGQTPHKANLSISDDG